MFTYTHIRCDPLVTLLATSNHSSGSTTENYRHGNKELASLDNRVSPSSAAFFFFLTIV